MVSLLAIPCSSFHRRVSPSPVGQVSIIRRVCLCPTTSLRLPTPHHFGRSFSITQKIMAPTKRPSAEGDRSISPPPLKRKAQTAISSSLHCPSFLCYAVSACANTSCATYRERGRKLLYPRIPETKGPNHLDREKPRCRLACHPSCSQVRPGRIADEG